jgi:3-dehydroquinate synthase
VLPPGEGTKNPDTLFAVLSWMMANGADRGAVVIALGGGVIGDIAGLAAALALRGMDYIQIPTTLLAQVDSAVGGKTAVNMPQGKNLVGAFHQPAAVICDTDMLATLPPRERRAGYAEIVKYGLIDDAAFFEWLEGNGADVLALKPEAVAHAVAVSCAAKARIVARDERDNDMRMLLNFGHTFAHGIEAAAGYDGSVLHGEAVAAGMAMAADYSQHMGLCGDAARIKSHLEAQGLPTGAAQVLSPDKMGDVIAAMKHDKKAQDGRMTLVLTRGIGKAFIQRDADADSVGQFIKRMM